MPPALSDVESSDNDIPASKTTAAAAAAATEDDNDDDVEEDEYVVEKILGHRFNKGVLEFDVKWQGYDNPRDRTWEPEENMETAADVLTEYFDDIGGRPQKPTKGTKRKGPAAATALPADSAKRSRKAPASPPDQPWSPPPGTWEHDVSHIDTVEQSRDPKTGQDVVFAYIVWNNHKKTQHPLKHIYAKCPQKMLQYYESHLVFTTTDDSRVKDEGDLTDLKDVKRANANANDTNGDAMDDSL